MLQEDFLASKMRQKEAKKLFRRMNEEVAENFMDSFSMPDIPIPRTQTTVGLESIGPPTKALEKAQGKASKTLEAAARRVSKAKGKYMPSWDGDGWHPLRR